MSQKSILFHLNYDTKKCELRSRSGHKAKIIKIDRDLEMPVIAEIYTPEPIIVGNSIDGLYSLNSGELNDLDLVLVALDVSVSPMPKLTTIERAIARDETSTNKPSALDRQTGGDHYKKMAIQPVVYCQKNKLNSIESSIVRYVSRHGSKNGREDIEKAIHLLELLLELEY